MVIIPEAHAELFMFKVVRTRVKDRISGWKILQVQAHKSAYSARGLKFRHLTIIFFEELAMENWYLMFKILLRLAKY